MIRKYFAELINKGNMLFFFFNLCLEACNFWNQETLFWSAITAYDVTHQFHQSCQEMGLSHNWMKQQDRTSYRKENDDCWSALERTLQARGKKKNADFAMCHWQWILQCSLLVERILLMTDQTWTLRSLQSTESILCHFTVQQNRIE